MASITKHGDGWRAFVFKHGFRPSKTFKTKREAQSWALRKEAELDALAAGGGRTFGALFSLLLDELLIDGLTFHDSRATALTLLSRRMDVLRLARFSRHRDINILMNTYYRATAAQISEES